MKEGFLEKYNTDDIFFRGVILGLLRNLNNKVTYSQTRNNTPTEIHIPFFFTLAGDEPFLQDNYLDYGDCDDKARFAEGNFDVVPRGVIEFFSSSIVSSSSTNKFVRATYTKEVGEEMKAYSAYLNSIPVSITFNVKIKVDTINEAFKIQQRYIQVLYRNFIYHFEFEGFRVPVQCSIPDSFPEKPGIFSFSYANPNKDITMITQITIETYLPQIDPHSERFRGNLMQGGISYNVEIGQMLPDNTIIESIGVTGATGSIRN
jgi:hypothetical protein